MTWQNLLTASVCISVIWAFPAAGFLCVSHGATQHGGERGRAGAGGCRDLFLKEIFPLEAAEWKGLAGCVFSLTIRISNAR